MSSLFAASSADVPFPILSALVVTPFLGALLMLVLPNGRPEYFKQVAFLVSGAVAGMTAWVMVEFDKHTADEFQFVDSAEWIAGLGISWTLGLDGISLWLVVLTAALFPLAILAIEAEHTPTAPLVLRVSVAPPLDDGVADAVLYVLDPEPELFHVAAMHMYSRFGYENDPTSSKYSQLRRCAIVGVGHHPDSFRATDQGWDIPALRELRRRDYWKEYQHFLNTLVDTVVPFAEEVVLGREPTRESFAKRALLGSSLSGVPPLPNPNAAVVAIPVVDALLLRAPPPPAATSSAQPRPLERSVPVFARARSCTRRALLAAAADFVVVVAAAAASRHLPPGSG